MYTVRFLFLFFFLTKVHTCIEELQYSVIHCMWREKRKLVCRSAASVRCQLSLYPCLLFPFVSLLEMCCAGSRGSPRLVSTERLFLPTLCIRTSGRSNLLEPLNVRAGSCTSFPALMWVLHTKRDTQTHTRTNWSGKCAELRLLNNITRSGIAFWIYHLRKGSFSFFLGTWGDLWLRDSVGEARRVCRLLLRTIVCLVRTTQKRNLLNNRSRFCLYQLSHQPVVQIQPSF